MSETTSVVYVGVGGQGVLLASEITARAAIAAGFDVKTNEVHGMAQRGGSVIAQIRYGENVASPLVQTGTAKVLGGLEQVEPLRHHRLLAPGGLAVVSSQIIVPTTVSTGQADYPDDVPERLGKLFQNLRYLEAVEEAEKLGDPRAANTVVVGAVSTGLDLPADAWREALEGCLKSSVLQLNLAAFEKGRELA